VTPHRSSAEGSFRFDRVFRGIGRLAKASGVHGRREFQQLDAFLTRLYERGRFDLIRGCLEDRHTVLELYAAELDGRLQAFNADRLLEAPLWATLSAWLPRSAAAVSSRRRYETSVVSFRRTGALGAGAKLKDLPRVDWQQVHASWPAGPADWNRMRAMWSRFLTVTLGDKYHPLRRQLLTAIPRATEPPGREPDVTPALFWQIVAAAPEYVQASYVCLVATGLRLGEYLRCRKEHLLPHTTSLNVPGRKTATSAAVLPIDERLWPWVVRAIPAPRSAKWLRRAWQEACAAVGVTDLRLHDLRHCFGQWLVDAGQSEASVQASLRHATPAMTRRYTMRKLRASDAAAMATVLLGAPAVAKPARRRKA